MVDDDPLRAFHALALVVLAPGRVLHGQAELEGLWRDLGDLALDGHHEDVRLAAVLRDPRPDAGAPARRASREQGRHRVVGDAAVGRVGRDAEDDGVSGGDLGDVGLVGDGHGGSGGLGLVLGVHVRGGDACGGGLDATEVRHGVVVGMLLTVAPGRGVVAIVGEGGDSAVRGDLDGELAASRTVEVV